MVRPIIAHNYYYTRLTALSPGLPVYAGTRNAKPIWILLKQETVSGNGISWAICKSAHRSRQITTPARHHSVFFTGRMPFLPPNKQRQSTEGSTEMKVSWFKSENRQTDRRTRPIASPCVIITHLSETAPLEMAPKRYPPMYDVATN